MHGLVNVVFVGALIFYIVRQVGGRRSVNPAPVLEARSTIAAEPVPFHSAPAQRKPPALVKTSVPSSLSDGGTRYIIGDQHAGQNGDRTKAMLQMISGPGICTPADR